MDYGRDAIYCVSSLRLIIAYFCLKQKCSEFNIPKSKIENRKFIILINS